MIAFSELMVLAQAPSDPGGPGGGGGGQLLWGIIIMLMVFYGFMMWGGRKDKQKREEMLRNIKKGDRVLTVGGIIGSVVSTSGNEVSVKVDESANVKVTVVRNAIQRVLQDNEKPSSVG